MTEPMTSSTEAIRTRRTSGVGGARRKVFDPSVASVLGILAAVWGFVAAGRTLSDNSLFTHIATGRVILDTGSVPSADVYSYTAHGADWLVQSWLVSVVYAAVEQLVGPWGIRLVAGAIGAATAVGLWGLTRAARTLFSRLLVFVPAMLVAGIYWSARPLLVGYLGFVLVLLSVQRRWSPVWMLPIMWIWVNSHGSFSLAVVLMVAVIVGRRLDGREVRSELVRLAWMVGGILAGCIGPLGPSVLLFPLELLERSQLLQQVVEWASPQFWGAQRLFLLQLVLAVVALLRRPTWRWGVPALAFVVLALLSTRNVPIASFVLVPAMAPGLAGIGSLTGNERGVGVRVAALVALVPLVVVAVTTAQAPAYDLHGYPTAAAAVLASEGRLGTPEHTLSSDVTGNYLTLVGGTDAGVFVDDRYDMYPLGLLQRFLVVRAASPGWQDVLDDCGVSSVLFDRTQPLVQVLLEDPAWRLRFSDRSFALFERRGPVPDVTSTCTEAIDP